MKWISLCIVLCCTPLTGLAEELPKLTEAERKQLTDKISTAKSQYNEGEFSDALQSFNEAYAVYPHPDLLYRIALCHERLGEDGEAVRYYRQFLEAVPEAPERPRIEKTIQMIEKRISQSELSIATTPTGATVYINDTSNGPAGYSPTSLQLEPGTYTVIVDRNGYRRIEEQVDLESGKSVQLRYQLEPVQRRTNPPPPTVEQPAARGSNPYVPWTIGFTALSVVSGIGTYVLYNSYRSKQSELDDLEANKQQVTQAMFEDVESERNTLLVGTLVGAGVTVTSITVAYIMYSKASDWNDRVAIMPTVDGKRVGIGVVGQW